MSVASGSDDAEQAPTGGVDLASSDLELVTDGTTVQRVGLRFANLQVPAGATITRAWIQFQTDEVSTDTAALTLRAEAADNAPTYLAHQQQRQQPGRSPRASVRLEPARWTTVGARTAAQQTPDLAALVQAVVSRPGWAQGNALAVQVTGTGRRTAEAFDRHLRPLAPHRVHQRRRAPDQPGTSGQRGCRPDGDPARRRPAWTAPSPTTACPTRPAPPRRPGARSAAPAPSPSATPAPSTPPPPSPRRAPTCCA